MTRQLFLAITLIGTAMLLNSTAEAVTAPQCENRAANCMADAPTERGGRRLGGPSEQMFTRLRPAADQMYYSHAMTRR